MPNTRPSRLPCPNCGAELRLRPETERITCRACGQEYAVVGRDGAPLLKPVLTGEARAVGITAESARAEADRLAREAAELQALMDRSDTESRRALRSRYTLARVGGALLAIGLAFRFLLRQQAPLVLLAAVAGAVILVAALSSIKGLTDTHRRGRRLRQEALEAKVRELERLREQVGHCE